MAAADYGRIRPFAQFLGAPVTEIAGLDLRILRRNVAMVVAIGLTLPAFGQGVDPLIGTWKINLEKSTATFTIPKDLSFTYSVEGDTIIGRGRVATFTMKFDGPITGNPNSDAAAYTRVGNTINMVSFKNGKVVEISQLGITDKTYMTTGERIAADGQLSHYTLVWDRQ